jgi:hypothetical protein
VIDAAICLFIGQTDRFPLKLGATAAPSGTIDQVLIDGEFQAIAANIVEANAELTARRPLRGAVRAGAAFGARMYGAGGARRGGRPAVRTVCLSLTGWGRRGRASFGDVRVPRSQNARVIPTPKRSSS